MAKELSPLNIINSARDLLDGGDQQGAIALLEEHHDRLILMAAEPKKKVAAIYEACGPEHAARAAEYSGEETLDIATDGDQINIDEAPPPQSDIETVANLDLDLPEDGEKPPADKEKPEAAKGGEKKKTLAQDAGPVVRERSEPADGEDEIIPLADDDTPIGLADSQAGAPATNSDESGGIIWDAPADGLANLADGGIDAGDLDASGSFAGVAINDDFKIALSSAAKALKKRKPQDAIDTLAPFEVEAFEKDDTDADKRQFMFMYGNSLYGLGQKDKARDYLDALAQNPHANEKIVAFAKDKVAKIDAAKAGGTATVEAEKPNELAK